MNIKTVLKKKSLGILMHPTSIPGGRVSGTFGKGTKDWIKKLNKHGIEYWQFLPLTPTDSTGSPYSSPSSFALNPWFLDIDYLIEEGFISISNLEELGPTNQNKNYFDFDAANNLTKKIGLLLLHGLILTTGLLRILGLKIMQHLLLLERNLICCLGGNGLKNLK